MIEGQNDSGFTLIEVLIALLILVLASGAISQAVSSGTVELARAARERDAITLADSVLAQIGHAIALTPGHLAGMDGAMSWTANIADALVDPSPASGLAAYPVSVEVRWPDDRRRQTYRLDSVRLGPQQTNR